MKQPIYLDYMATTPVAPAVAAMMQECLTMDGCFGNSASVTHSYGYSAADKITHATQQVAELIHADPREIVWTSGATESNNLAIIGAALFYQRQGKHIITMRTEHKAVLDTCVHLESQGFEITYLEPLSNGLLDPATLHDAIRSDTILMSIMHVNNETGMIQDIAALGNIARSQGVLFHVDAAQSGGRLVIDLNKLPVDLMSFSAHKAYGPKGIGVLYVRRQPRVHLQPLIYGGGHQHGLRSGTLATHQIVGMGAAFSLVPAAIAVDGIRIRELRDRLWQGIEAIGGVHLNGQFAQMIGDCLNVCFTGIDGESLLLRLQDLALSQGSACSAADMQPSHVLMAMGLTREQANQSLRLSIGRYTTLEEIDHAIEQIQTQVRLLRQMAP